MPLLCENCGTAVDDMEEDAIGRFRKDGTELAWCSDECFRVWARLQAEGGEDATVGVKGWLT